MKNISLNIDKVTGFVTREQIMALEPQVKRAQQALEEGTLPGNDFLGWLHLPSTITQEHLDDLKATAGQVETFQSRISELEATNGELVGKGNVSLR